MSRPGIEPGPPRLEPSTLQKSHSNSLLKRHGNEVDFLGFLHKWVRHRYLNYISSRSDFDFEFAEIFVIENKCYQIFESFNGVRTLHPRLIFG